MDVSESRRPDGDTDPLSFIVGLIEMSARGLRMSTGRAIPGEKVLNIALGAALVGGEIAAQTLESVRGLVGPRVSGLVRPPRLPSLPTTWRSVRLVEDLRQRGRQERLDDARAVEQALDLLVPVVAEALVRRLDLDALVRDYVDIEAIIAGLDLDAIVSAVDIDAVAKRLDLDAVIDRLDLNAIVRDRVDLDAIIQSVDIDAVAARLDLDAIIDRLELPVLAQQVIDEIDLPEIIRESSGSMASEAVRGVRMHSIEADDAVARALDRVLGHRRSGTPKASDPAVPAPHAEIAVPMKVEQTVRNTP